MTLIVSPTWAKSSLLAETEGFERGTWEHVFEASDLKGHTGVIVLHSDYKDREDFSEIHSILIDQFKGTVLEQ